jgi:hypothetical protein
MYCYRNNVITAIKAEAIAIGGIMGMAVTSLVLLLSFPKLSTAEIR